jgi:hypothetical protein
MYRIADEMLVGGEVLDLALSRAKPHARFVICGGKSWNEPRECCSTILTQARNQPI